MTPGEWQAWTGDQSASSSWCGVWRVSGPEYRTADRSEGMSPMDAFGIVALRNHAPALLAEVTRLRADVEMWKLRADKRWSQQDIDNAKRSGDLLHQTHEQQERIDRIEAETVERCAKVLQELLDQYRSEVRHRTTGMLAVSSQSKATAIENGIAAIRGLLTSPREVPQ